MGLLDSLKGAKDMAISAGATAWLNSQLVDYGKIVLINLDSTAKRVEMEALLTGEKEAVKVCVEEYEIVQQGTQAYLRFARIDTSREWLNNLLSKIVLPKYAPGNQVPIPANYAAIIGMVM